MKLLIVDFETSGLNPKHHAILEIGAICCSTTLEIEWKFETKLQPFKGAVMDPEALDCNGYTKKEWKNAPSFSKGFKKFYKHLEKDQILVCKNPTFDRGFYNAAIRRLALADHLHYHSMDLLGVAFPFLPSDQESYSMKSISAALKIKGEPDVHTAFNGALNCYKILKHILKKTKEL